MDYFHFPKHRCPLLAGSHPKKGILLFWPPHPAFLTCFFRAAQPCLDDNLPLAPSAHQWFDEAGAKPGVRKRCKVHPLKGSPKNYVPAYHCRRSCTIITSKPDNLCTHLYATKTCQTSHWLPPARASFRPSSPAANGSCGGARRHC